MFNASNLNTRLKRIILFIKKTVWFFLKNNYRSSSISQKISESQRNRMKSEFHAAFTQWIYRHLIIFQEFNALSFQSNPYSASNIFRGESKFALYIASHSQITSHYFLFIFPLPWKTLLTKKFSILIHLFEYS